MQEPRSFDKRAFQISLWHFAAVSVTGMSLTFVFASILAPISDVQPVGTFIELCVIISTLVSIPIAAIFSQTEYHLQKQKRLFRSLATTDSLTGLLNRRFFLNAFDEELQRLSRTGKNSCLILFDLDDFKGLNDRYGHVAGDDVLKSIAHLICDELRGPFDRVARWGGEEFIALVTEVTTDQAHCVCERLRLRIASHVFESDGDRIAVTASFGYVMISEKDTSESVVERSDLALYEAKRTGRNRTVAHADLEQAAA